LLASHLAPCISLYLPTHRRLPQGKQDPVRFKNLMRTAERLLRSEYTNRDTKALLHPLEELAQGDFWRGQMGGLALFRSFYEGSRCSLSQVDLPDLPKSLDESFAKEQGEAVLNAYAVGPGQAEAIYYGYGVSPEKRVKDKLAPFFRAVDTALWDDLLRNERAPVILAGVGYHHPIYRSVSRYPFLAEQTVEGNFDHVTPGHLHAKVWPVVHDFFRVREEQVLGEYAALSVRGQTTQDLFTIARATVSRRVGYLLIAQGAHVWVLMDRGSGRIVQRSAQPDTRDGDVLDDLAEATLAQGGEVVMLERTRLPGHSPVASILGW
jgi:hypothetical protein